MALLEWKKLNKNIEILNTRKKFFNEYYCSLKFKCAGARIILNSKVIDIDAAVAKRIEYDRSYRYNYGGSWKSYQNLQHDFDVNKLRLLKQITVEHKNSIKLRVEEPYVTLYSHEESTLFDIAKNYLVDYTSDLKIVHAPKDNYEKNLLEKGNIIIKNDVNYLYKFFCKSGHCQNKNALASYLYNLGDIVKVSDSVWTLLEDNTHNHIWNVWFYSNDASVANMLNIIEPNFVTNIHELVVSR